MKKIIIACSLCLFALSTMAQVPADTVRYWKKEGIASLNVNQVSLTNWMGGGQSSLSVAALVKLNSNYKKGNTIWENSVDMAYGVIQTPDIPFRKTDDRLELNSKWGHFWTRKFYYSALANFKTQFAPGYNFPNDSVVASKFLAPAYLLASAGVDWRPRDYFSLYFSPLTAKLTFVMDERLANEGAFGVTPADTVGGVITPGKKMRFELGAFMSMQFKKKLMENILFETRLTLFTSYTDPIKKHLGNIDVNWETLINMKVNQYLSMNLSTTLIYDHDVDVPIIGNVNNVETQIGKGPRVQFREVFGLALMYKLSR